MIDNVGTTALLGVGLAKHPTETCSDRRRSRQSLAGVRGRSHPTTVSETCTRFARLPQSKERSLRSMTGHPFQVFGRDLSGLHLPGCECRGARLQHQACSSGQRFPGKYPYEPGPCTPLASFRLRRTNRREPSRISMLPTPAMVIHRLAL